MCGHGGCSEPPLLSRHPGGLGPAVARHAVSPCPGTPCRAAGPAGDLPGPGELAATAPAFVMEKGSCCPCRGRNGALATVPFVPSQPWVRGGGAHPTRLPRGTRRALGPVDSAPHAPSPAVIVPTRAGCPQPGVCPGAGCGIYPPAAAAPACARRGLPSWAAAALDRGLLTLGEGTRDWAWCGLVAGHLHSLTAARPEVRVLPSPAASCALG